MSLNALFDLTGKTVVVTGGGRGLGKQMALGLAEAGANIVICSRNLEACQKACQEIEHYGVKSLALACDITKQEDIERVIEITLKTFETIDILINNSGTSWVAPALDVPGDKWDKVMEVNVKGMFLFSQAVAKVMVNQNFGKIINISSILGLGGTPSAFLDALPYNTSKGAVISFTKDLAVKLAHKNIQVNAIAPGLFPTKMTKVLEKEAQKIVSHIPLGRFGNEEDLKGTALFLSSKASDYITGHVLVVDGGISSSII